MFYSGAEFLPYLILAFPNKGNYSLSVGLSSISFFLFAFRTVEGIVSQDRILSYSVTGFIAANGAQYPF